VIHSDHANTKDKGQSLALIERLPFVHQPLHVLTALLPSIDALMSGNFGGNNGGNNGGSDNLSLFKALDLAGNMIKRVAPGSVGAVNLELAQHTEFLQKLMKVIVYNPLENFRQMAFKVFDGYFRLFSASDGCYRLCAVLLEIANHSGLIGYVIGKVKDATLNHLNGRVPAPEFQGHELRVLVRKFARLSNGAETDLLEVSDEVMACLNFLVGLFIRDGKSNASGILDMKAEIQEGFLTPLETGINMSRAHYQAKLEASSDRGSNPDDLVDDDLLSVQVGGQPLPHMDAQGRKKVVEAALNTFSMMECVLIQLKDVLDKQK